MVKLKPGQKKTEVEVKKGGKRFLPLGMLAGPASSLLPMLLSNWKLGIFALLIGFIVYQNYMTLEILKPVGFRTIPGILQEVEEDKLDFAAIEQQLQACNIGAEKLKTEVEVTNQQIAKWVEVSKELQAGNAKLNKALIDLKAQSTKEVEIILQGPIPQTCEGAMKLLRDAITKGDLSWQ